MITHYLKVAVRNLLKYKTQTIISILGLAVGFACFALSVIWIRYEMTYDTFHENAEQIHIIRKKDNMTMHSKHGVNNHTPYLLAQHLKENFAEVKAACAIQGGYGESEIIIDQQIHKMHRLSIDSMAFSVFDIRILEGSDEFLTLNSNKVAITRRTSQRIFGDESPIGKEIYNSYNRNKPLTICAVVSEWPEHSNLNYDLIDRCYPNDKWGSSGWQTFVRLHDYVSSDAFCEKIENLVIEVSEFKDWKLTGFMSTPITRLRYNYPIAQTEIEFQHVILFAIASGLVILCCLLNYIGLFVSQIRNRSKEFALRMVNGASSFRLFKMLMTEYLLLLFISWFVSMMCVEQLLPFFKEVSGVKLSQMEVYQQTSVCCLMVIFLSTVMASVPILHYRRKSVQSILNAEKDGKEKNLFRKGTLLSQLIISIGIIFCASVIVKQLHFLNHSADAGITRKNIAALIINQNTDEQMLLDKFKQLPEVENAIVVCNPLIPVQGMMSIRIKDWEDKKADAEPIDIEILTEDSTYTNMYGLTLLEGEMITPSSPNTDIVLNESAVKALGWHRAIGKQLYGYQETFRVIGVLKDYHINAPTMPVRPIAFQLNSMFSFGGSTCFLLKFKEGMWKDCEQKVGNIIKETYPETHIQLTNTEEEYNKYLTSEKALLRLLSIFSLVCILLSIFGIYSQIVLTCEQRRKEIAIRKVNGAKVSDILSMFAKEYTWLLIIASGITFPIGYTIMKHWLESYTLQTPINWWIFASIVIGIAGIIAMSIGYRVWKAANENPADVVKSE